MAMEMELIERFQDSAQASILRDMLKGSGFHPKIQGQGGLGGSGARIAGGYLVMVPRAELAEVREYLQLLEEEARLQEVDDEPLSPTPTGPGTCPFCQSTQIVQVNTSSPFRAIMTVLLLGLPLLFAAPRAWRCNSCEQQWH